ncbi:MAG: hypothetical protein ACREMM_12245 [Gemmatimonadales bacterium]
MTELIWEGKYDDKGRKVAPPRIALALQTVETVNDSAADRDRDQDLLASRRPTDWRNRLIWGDKKYVLPSLLEEFAEELLQTTERYTFILTGMSATRRKQ